VLGGVPAFLFLLAAIGAYPWVFIPLLVLGGLAYTVDRERRRRLALVARADWEHHAMNAAPVPDLRPLSQRQAPTLSWQMNSLLRTEPLPVNNRPRLTRPAR